MLNEVKHLIEYSDDFGAYPARFFPTVRTTMRDVDYQCDFIDH